MATLLAVLMMVLAYVMDFGLFSGESISLERLDSLLGLIILYLVGDSLDCFIC